MPHIRNLDQEIVDLYFECMDKLPIGIRNLKSTGILSLARRSDSPDQLYELRKEFNSDLDETLRKLVAKEVHESALVPEKFPELFKDASPYVRRNAVDRMRVELLPAMIKDESHFVRFIVAKRIDIEHLPKFINDVAHVRRVVAQRIEEKYLVKMINDTNPKVRLEVAKRIDFIHIGMLATDKNLDVRLAVFARAPKDYQHKMLKNQRFAKIVLEKIHD